MSENLRITVLAGGTSQEREVSLGSGRACAEALARSFPTRFLEVTADALPVGLESARDIVFSTLHGTFGEDGRMQALLDGAGVPYAGCDAASSAFTMDKTRTKEMAAAAGVPVGAGMYFGGTNKPKAETLLAKLGSEIVFKPNAEGSSVGLQFARGEAEIGQILAGITKGDWLAETRLVGRELSVGVLHGKALGIVEIKPHSGVYDYTSKYTKGFTEYTCPALLSEDVTAEVRKFAETTFVACGCRDYARVDFIWAEQPYLLEVNTLPGMKETSLLPMSAAAFGLNFTQLVKAMVEPAMARRAATIGVQAP